MDFDACFLKLVDVEKGYVMDPRDPGGATNLGITARSYPQEDIPHMTLERAKFLYRRDFWDQAGCGVVPGALRFDLFDASVNSGPHQAVKFLQTAVGTTADGSIGPKTLMALAAMTTDRVLMRFEAARLIFMAGLPQWPAFGRGWAIRVANNILSA